MTQDLVLLAAGIGLGLGLLYAGMVFALWKTAVTLPTHFHWVMFLLGIIPLLGAEALWLSQAPATLSAVGGYLGRGLILIVAGALDILAYLLHCLWDHSESGTIWRIVGGRK